MSKRLLLLLTLSFILISFLGWGMISGSNKNNGNGLKVYFFMGDKLYPVSRILGGSRTPQYALQELFKGPTEIEKAKGIYTQIPADLSIVNIKTTPSMITIVFNDALLSISGGTARTNGVLAQIVYTATQIPGINYVNIELENKEQPIIIGGEGIVIDKPLSCSDYREYK